jgi:uncharacterized RDD family membrane protein YckC
VRLRDLNSSNGTFVNDKRVQSETEVVDGDRIVLGETEMRFHAAAPEGMAAFPLRVATVEELDVDFEEPETEAASDLPPPPPTIPPVAPVVPIAPAVASRANSKSPTDQLLPVIDEIGPPPAPLPRPAAAVRPSRAPDVALARTPAGFWIRLAAALLDGVWIGLLTGGAVALPFLLDVPASLASALPAAAGLASAAVVIFGWARWGTTPGKRLLGLQVSAANGSPGIGLGKALLRWLGYFLSFALLGAGFFLIAFSKDKRGLHDLLAGTTVVRR